MSIMKIVVVIELHNRAANTLHQKLLPVLEEAKDEPDPVQLCGITAMLGDYEKTPKEPMEQLGDSKFPLFLMTDQEHLLHPDQDELFTSAWTRVRVNSSLWQEDCFDNDYVGARIIHVISHFCSTLENSTKCNFTVSPSLLKQNAMSSYGWMDPYRLKWEPSWTVWPIGPQGVRTLWCMFMNATTWPIKYKQALVLANT
jgi:hypothetical protein